MDNGLGGENNPRVFYSSPPQQSPHDWGTALVMACLALGFVMSWAVYEYRQRLAQESSVVHIRHDLDILTSQQGDLGQLLADPHTRLVTMSAVDNGWPAAGTMVAWNDARQSGVLFSAVLNGSNGLRFKLWLGAAAGEGV